MTMTRLALIVSGDRAGTKDFETTRRWELALIPVFSDLRRQYDDVVLLTGACGLTAASSDQGESGEMKGVDAIADRIGRSYGFTVVPMPAPWLAGDSAGPRRNEAMDRVQAALGFVGYDELTIGCHNYLPGSKGTASMLRLSRARGVETRHLTSDGGGES